MMVTWQLHILYALKFSINFLLIMCHDIEPNMLEIKCASNTSFLRLIILNLVLVIQVKRYFEYKDPNGTVNEVWRQVSQKLPLIKLMISCDRRLATMHVTEPDCSACLCSNQSGIATT